MEHQGDVLKSFRNSCMYSSVIYTTLRGRMKATFVQFRNRCNRKPECSPFKFSNAYYNVLFPNGQISLKAFQVHCVLLATSHGLNIHKCHCNYMNEGRNCFIIMVMRSG